MKNQKLNILVIAFVAIMSIFSLGSCRKASDNGKLDGQWQILSIEDVATGKELPVTQQLYICINLHIMQLTRPGGIAFSGNMIYDKSGGNVSCDFPYATTPNHLKTLQQWGIYSNPVEFKIVKLTNKNLVFKTDATIISCRKF